MDPGLSDTNVTCFIQKHSVAKFVPIRYVMNVLPKIKFLDVITAFTPLTVFVMKSFPTNKISLHRARSGFEPEMPVAIVASCSVDPMAYVTQGI
jgi:hypothetical protein